MKKNDYFEATCIDMTHDGKGVIKYKDFTYFVNHMLPGEVGKVKVIKILKSYGIVRLIELIKVSPNRNDPKCSIFKQCGGCHLQHLTLQGQQEYKTKRVKDTLARIGHCDVFVQDCIMMEDPWYYRNKVQMPIGYNNNQMVVGFYKQRTNEIIPCQECYIQNKESNAIIQDITGLCQKYHISPYDKETGKGNLRHVLTKFGSHTNDIMVVFITNERVLPHIEEIIHFLTKKYPNIKTIMQNINQRQDNVILGKEIHVLYGPGYIQDTLLGNTFKISLHSFYQINPMQTEKLYTTAIQLADIKKDDIVIDAYCGIGTIALSVAKHAQRVYGVEIVPQAIEDAKENANSNHISNVHFTCIDAGEYMEQLAQEKKHIDVVFLDPPRKGCSTILLASLVSLQPAKIMYISCDVATQARDIAYLEEHGYKATICQPVDMFPHTYHVENIVLLQRC